jgi:hypothetical protein
MKSFVIGLASVVVFAGVSFAGGEGAGCGGCEGEAKQAEKADECGGCEGEAQQAGKTEKAEEGCGGCASVASNPMFDRLKTLEGEWVGTMGEEKTEIRVSYKLTAGGSALMETLMPGTPKEMVTLYHLDGVDVVLTHFCASGSQPQMKLAKIKGEALHFEFTKGTNCDPAEGFMGGLVMTLGEDTTTYAWTVLKDGKPAQTIEFTLNRVRETGK